MNTKPIRDLLDKISPWPWHVDYKYIAPYVTEDHKFSISRKDEEGNDASILWCEMGYGHNRTHVEANADFIALAPQIISDLLNENDKHREFLGEIARILSMENEGDEICAAIQITAIKRWFECNEDYIKEICGE